MYRPLSDYALIGNERTAALVSKNASIDWLPTPWLDSPSVFGAVLDVQRGGSWAIESVEAPRSITQTYEHHSNVLVTRFVTSTGEFTVTDFIALPSDDSSTVGISCLLYRRISCVRGTCTARSRFAPRFDYGRGTTMVASETYGLLAQHPCGIARLFDTTSSWTLRRRDTAAEAVRTLRSGDQWDMVLDVRDDDDGALPSFVSFDQAHATANAHWQSCVTTLLDHPQYQRAGEWQPALVRSLLVLRMMFVSPFGTMAAAPTTSLPEELGGIRNWDYRYNWIRDTGLALQTLLKWGQTDIAARYWRSFVEEILDDIVAHPEALQCIYGLRWQRDLSEEILPHLSGYADSQPVRIGNGAYRQRQWDNYGVLMDFLWSLYSAAPGVVLADRDAALRLVRAIAHHAAAIWREPDDGIWEVRGGAQHFVYSKVMCWVALDRASKLAHAFGSSAEATTWASEATVVHEEIHLRGWNPDIQAFAQSFDSTAVDASVLRLPRVGFVDGRDLHMKTTVDQIHRDLGIGDDLLMRYRSFDGLEGTEGAFLITSFWLVDAYALAGEYERAQEVFTSLLSRANHVGLYPEELDPVTGAFLGNFPQAYSHIGLLESVHTLLTAPPSSVPITSHASATASA